MRFTPALLAGILSVASASAIASTPDKRSLLSCVAKLELPYCCKLTNGKDLKAGVICRTPTLNPNDPDDPTCPAGYTPVCCQGSAGPGVALICEAP